MEGVCRIVTGDVAAFGRKLSTCSHSITNYQLTFILYVLRWCDLAPNIFEQIQLVSMTRAAFLKLAGQGSKLFRKCKALLGLDEVEAWSLQERLLHALRAGAAFWSYVYFQGLVNPTVSDFAPLNSLPESARGTALASADYLHDMLRWCLGRFGKLQDICGQISSFMGQVAEADLKTKQQFNTMTEQLHELSNGVFCTLVSA